MNATHMRFYHPASAALFCALVIVAAFLSPNLAISLATALVAATIVLILISHRQSRITFAVIVGLCALFILLRLALIAISTHADSSAFSLPKVVFPTWLGSLQLGGKVDINSIISSAHSMTTLTSIVIACCAFSFLIGPHRMIHLIPRRMHALRETTHITSNVLWRAPNEIRLISEAQHRGKTSKFTSARYIFPAFISELVNQSTTHAGVIDLRKNAITHNARWFRFTFARRDFELVGLCISLTFVFAGLLLVVR